jgi:hypothetical protein
MGDLIAARRHLERRLHRMIRLAIRHSAIAMTHACELVLSVPSTAISGHLDRARARGDALTRGQELSHPVRWRLHTPRFIVRQFRDLRAP